MAKAYSEIEEAREMLQEKRREIEQLKRDVQWWTLQAQERELLLDVLKASLKTSLMFAKVLKD